MIENGFDIIYFRFLFKIVVKDKFRFTLEE